MIVLSAMHKNAKEGVGKVGIVGRQRDGTKEKKITVINLFG
jgi:hypothetical protein